MTAITAFRQCLQQAQAQAAVVYPHGTLRPSALPYCGLRNTANEFNNKQDLWDFFANYYTSVGGAVHEVFQMHLGLTGQIWGDWECQDCGTERKFAPYSPCSHCRGQMIYKEMTLTYKGMPGHLDGLFCVKRKIKGKLQHLFYAIDYKTTSRKTIERHGLTTNLLPYHHNKRQIEAYCVSIERTFKVKIQGWLLIYVCRDQPGITEVVGEELNSDDKQEISQRLDFYVKQYRLHENLTIGNLQELIATKPCKSLAAYQTEYHSDFHPCDLATSGQCFKKDLAPKMIKLYRTYKQELREALGGH